MYDESLNVIKKEIGILERHISIILCEQYIQLVTSVKLHTNNV